MYYVKVTYYDVVDTDEKSFHALVPADNMSEAVKVITDEWSDSDVEEITIRQIQFDYSRIVYIPKECVDQVVEENSY